MSLNLKIGATNERRFGAQPFFDHGDIVLALQIEPELRAVAEVSAQPYRGVGGDRPLCVEDVGDATRRHAASERQTVGAELAGAEFAFQKPAWVRGGSHIPISFALILRSAPFARVSKG
jgi:hypothetical protein